MNVHGGERARHSELPIPDAQMRAQLRPKKDSVKFETTEHLVRKRRGFFFFSKIQFYIKTDGW